jgi:hypothetical protein
VQYDPVKFLDDLLQEAESVFNQCEGAKMAPDQESIKEFVTYYLGEVSLALCAAFVKDPAFQAENEWRLVCELEATELPPSCFRQRSSMMSRHMPLSFKYPLPSVPRLGDELPSAPRSGDKLPIVGVRVGPCRYPELSELAVHDLLASNGYDTQKIDISKTKIPYRIP